ncbi:MAG: hypothetical protein NUV69_00990 [Candidatus Curtissbacteria bacterium]|nr:hypothetical protein [Candidatus Curtissbacteria bacterium]
MGERLTACTLKDRNIDFERLTDEAVAEIKALDVAASLAIQVFADDIGSRESLSGSVGNTSSLAELGGLLSERYGRQTVDAFRESIANSADSLVGTEGHYATQVRDRLSQWSESDLEGRAKHPKKKDSKKAQRKQASSSAVKGKFQRHLVNSNRGR